MTVEQLSQYAGIVLSLALAYIPGIANWYDKQDAKGKAGIMAVFLALTAATIFALACAGLAGDLGVGVVCDKSSAIELIKIFITALIANQATFLLAVRPFKK